MSPVDPFERTSFRQVRVGRVMVGMNGLDEIFSTLYAEGFEANDAVIPALLERARRHNYIPSISEDIYGKALLHAFQEFWRRKSVGGAGTTEYGTWRGHPREAIPWYPDINPGRCDACGVCVRFCANGVFGQPSGGDVQVVEPFKCLVGCSTCVRVCKPGAISFPPKDMLKTFG